MDEEITDKSLLGCLTVARKPQRYWKSLKILGDKIVSGYDGSEWDIGEWRNNPYPVTEECEGLNCCPHVIDAMRYVACDILAEVKVRGKKIVGADKLTVQEMKIERAWVWTKEDSVSLSIYSAEQVIGLYEEKYPDDARPREAIEAARRYLETPTGKTADAAAYAAADASARLEMKKKIQNWIISHLKNKEGLV